MNLDGNLEADSGLGAVKVRGLGVTGYILLKNGTGINSSGYIKAGGRIEAKGYIEAGRCEEHRYRIYADDKIQ